MADLDASSTDSMLISDSFQLTFCFCLFGFFGTIISTSWYLHWSAHKKINDIHQSEVTNFNFTSSNNYNTRSTNINHPNNYKYPHLQHQYSQQQMNGHSKQHQQQILVANYQTQQLQQRQQRQQYQQHQQQQQQYYPLSRYHPQRQQQQQQQQRFNYNQNSNLCSNSTQIILDWDDTLFPTAYTLLNLKNGITSSSLICEKEWSQLQNLSNIVHYLLLMFIQYFGANNIVIVTNARMDWFNESCKIYKKLFGEIKNLLVNKYGISIISAHDTYSRQKCAAFMDLLQHKHEINKVLCFGDSNEEYDAIHNVCSALNIRGDKQGQYISYYRFKLMSSPSLNCMIKQLQFIKKLNYFAISQQSYHSSYHFK